MITLMVILISHLFVQRTQGIPCGRIGIATADLLQEGIDRDNENRYYSQMGHEDDPGKRRKPVAQPGAGACPVRRVSSSELMHQRSELIIEHDGREYRLRITQSGKLILTA